MVFHFFYRCFVEYMNRVYFYSKIEETTKESSHILEEKQHGKRL